MKMRPEKKTELDRLLVFLRNNRGDLGAIDHAAMHLHQRGFPLDAALQAYAQYLEHHPASAVAAFNHAWYLTRDGQFETAIRQYHRALELGIDGPEEALINIGTIWMNHMLDFDKARQSFQAALAENPRYFGAHYNLGNLEEQSGNRSAAVACFSKCLEIEPGNPSALARLADAQRFTSADDPLLAELQRHAATSDSSDLHYALGSAYNQLAAYESAWSHFSRANALDAASQPRYDANAVEATFDRIIAQTGRDWPDRFSGRSPKHVFICGMFRTGSTLLEQMLAAHPDFTSVGESEFFPRLVMREFIDFPMGLDEVSAADARTWGERHAEYANRFTGGAKRLTDKRPDNFQHVGLIKAVLPSAKFIVTERDWRDVAISIYTMRLGAGQNYATDLADIRHYIGQQRRLVAHWEGLFGGELLRLGYEDLVKNPREVLGGVLDFLGADWDDRCLAFETLGNAVKTGSVWQVREPLHSRSIGRWKNYGPYFERVFGASPSA